MLNQFRRNAPPPPLGYRQNIPLHRQTTSCLETLAFIVALYHFATGGYLTVRHFKEWFMESRHRQTYSTENSEIQQIKTPSEALDYLIMPFACRTAYQAVCCALGMFLANGIGQKNEFTAPKCHQWLLWMTTLNLTALLMVYPQLDFYSLTWNVVRSILEITVVSAFTTEIWSDEQEAALRQEILDRFIARNQLEQ